MPCIECGDFLQLVVLFPPVLDPGSSPIEPTRAVTLLVGALTVGTVRAKTKSLVCLLLKFR